MNSQDKISNNNPSADQEFHDQKKKNLKRQSSENKRSQSNNPQKMDIWQRNEMEKHRKMMVENQKRMKENTLKEKNEINKAERNQQDALEKLKREKKEQYEKYLRTNLRQNEDNYQKQKPIGHVLNLYEDQNNSKENIENADNSKKQLKPWVPKPVPLENASKYLEEQKIERELYENQLKQAELTRLLEERKMLDMYKNIPNAQNKQKYKNQPIQEEEDNNNNQQDHSSFSVDDGSQNLYVDSDNESQIRKKRKKNDNQMKQHSKSPSYSVNNPSKNLQSNNGSHQKQSPYNYEQQISIVQDTYDLYGGDRNKTPDDMLGFEAYNHPVKAKVYNQPSKNKPQDNVKPSNMQKDKSNLSKGNKINPEKQKSTIELKYQENQKKNEKRLSQQEQEFDQGNNNEWEFDDEKNENDEMSKKQQFVPKMLPNGMTNYHREVNLSKDFQKIKFEIEGEERGESRQTQKPSTSQTSKSKKSNVQQNVQEKQENIGSQVKKQLDQKDIEMLRLKQEHLIKEKKIQKQKEEDEAQKQSKQKQQSPNKMNEFTSTFENNKRDSFIYEFKQQFNDLKKQYNYHRQQTNSKTNLQANSQDQSHSQAEQAEAEQNKGNKQNQNKNSSRYQEQQQQIISQTKKTPITDYEDQENDKNNFLEQGDFDNEIKHQSLSQSGKIVRRTNYLKDVSKFSVKQIQPMEKPSYSKNMKERRKFWERKTNEDFLNQSIEDKATTTAISKFKSKLQSNINVDKQLNNQNQTGNNTPKTTEKQKQFQEWQKLNDQEIKLQREIFNMHFDNLDKIKEVEEKNNINTIQNLSQNFGNIKADVKSRILTAVSNKSSTSSKTNKTNQTSKTSTRKEGALGKLINHQINPISEIENEDDIEASLLNIDNKLSNQKNRILLMTAEIEQSQKPKNPQLRKELLKNPQILQQNPFSVDITSADKEYLEEEKSKYLVPQTNIKSSKLNISHISHISNSKEAAGLNNKQNNNNRPTSEKTTVTSSQLSSLAKIIPQHLSQPSPSAHSHQSLYSQDKLPKISQTNNNHIPESVGDKSHNEVQKQREGTSSTSQSYNVQRQLSKQTSNQSPLQLNNNQKNKSSTNLEQNITFGQNQQRNIHSKQSENNNINRDKDNDEKRKKEIELRKKFPEFFADEQIEETPVIKNKGKDQDTLSQNNEIKHKYQNTQDKEEEEQQSSMNNQEYQGYDVQPTPTQLPKRQESSKSIKKKQFEQFLPAVKPEVVENDKQELLHWWKQVSKSIDRSNENTPKLNIVSDKHNESTLSEDKKFSPKSKQSNAKNMPSLPNITDDFKTALQPNQSNQQIRQIVEVKVAQEIQEDKNSSNKENQEEMKKALKKKKFMEEYEQDLQEESNVKNNNMKNNAKDNNKQQNDQNSRKQLISIEFDGGRENKKVMQTKQKRIINEDGIEIDENEIMSDNPSIISKRNEDQSAQNNNKKQLNNLYGNQKSSESLAYNKVRQKSEENTPDSRSHLKKVRKDNSQSSSPNNPNKKRVERVLDQDLLAKVEFSQNKIEQTIKQTLERLEQVERDSVKQELENKKVNITKRKSELSQHSGYNEKELSEISQNHSFAESDFLQLAGNGNYATRQIIKKQYVHTRKVPSRYNHDNLYAKNNSSNNSFNDDISNMSSSKILSKRDNMQEGVGSNQSNLQQNKGAKPDQRDIIDEEEYQGDIKINRNVNLQKLLFVD